jgi:hypothetical protein
VPTDRRQVGAGGQADQCTARVAVHNLMADRDAGVLLPPGIQQCGQLQGGIGFDGSKARHRRR